MSPTSPTRSPGRLPARLTGLLRELSRELAADPPPARRRATPRHEALAIGLGSDHHR